MGPPPPSVRLRCEKNRCFIDGRIDIECRNAVNTRAGEPGRTITCEVERPVSVATSGCKAARMIRIARDHRLVDVDADLVGAQCDAWPDGGCDPAGLRTQIDHGGDRRLDHACDRAAPACMGRADHAGLAIGKQDRRAISGDDAQCDPGTSGHHRIGAWTGSGFPWLADLDDVGTVHLHQFDQSLCADSAQGACPVLEDGVAIIATRQAAIEARIGAGRYAALAGKEAMRRAERVGGQQHGRAFGHDMPPCPASAFDQPARGNIASSLFEPGRRRFSGSDERHCLEQTPHAVGFREPARRFDQRTGTLRRLRAREAAGALEQSQPGQEHALRNRSVGRRAGLARGIGQCLEIDMGGQVGVSGIGKRFGRPPIAQRLKTVAEGRCAPVRSQETARNRSRWKGGCRPPARRSVRARSIRR